MNFICHDECVLSRMKEKLSDIEILKSAYV